MPGDDSLHLLASLRLPSRYESLEQAVGPEVARILVAPVETTGRLFEDAAAGIRAQARGLFAPVAAKSGTGKSTLAVNLHHWFGDRYTPTSVWRGEITVPALTAVVANLRESLSPTDERVVPLAIEDREFAPPTDEELAQIKSFLRRTGGSKTLVMWLETDTERAIDISKRFIDAAGMSPIQLPLLPEGPPPTTWPEIAINTLKLVNGLESLEDLGVDPSDYHPSASRSLGDFLDRVSGDFVTRSLELLRATQKPLRLTVVFASQSDSPGILDALTGSRRFGGLEPHRLLAATPNSEIGRWWGQRQGFLTSVMYRLDTRVVSMSPSTAVPLLRRFGPPAVADLLDRLGIARRTDGEIAEYLGRSDLGKFLRRETRSMSETRGRPSSDAPVAFDLLGSEFGFGAGRDKLLNRAIADAISVFTSRERLGFSTISCETRLAVAPLIPDIGLVSDDLAFCLEFHWRRGEFLTSSNRSEVAQYVLSKLRDYARALNWIQG